MTETEPMTLVQGFPRSRLAGRRPRSDRIAAPAERPRPSRALALVVPALVVALVLAGGVINISCELGGKYNREKAKLLTSTIETTMLEIFKTAKRQGLPPGTIADRLAEEHFMIKAAA